MGIKFYENKDFQIFQLQQGALLCTGQKFDTWYFIQIKKNQDTGLETVDANDVILVSFIYNLRHNDDMMAYQNYPHIGQWRGAFMLSLICAWKNAFVNNREAGDLRRHRAHYDVIVTN